MLMNLRLHAESKFIIAYRQGEPLPVGSSHLWTVDLPPALPDALFEELGYHGALDSCSTHNCPTDVAGDDDFDSLFAPFAEPAFGAPR